MTTLPRIHATSDINIRYAGFTMMDLEAGHGFIHVSFDDNEFSFATSRDNPGDTEASNPEYRFFVEALVAGGQFDEEDHQHVGCFETVAALGQIKADAYSEVVWAMEGGPGA